MNLRPCLFVACSALILAFGTTEVSAGLITQWTFSTLHPAPYNSPSPEVGTGVARVLGMDNNYTFSGNNTITGSGTFTLTGPSSVGSVASADVTSTSGDPSGYANAWRVRGPSNNLGDPQGNGWALQAPQYTQGAEFDSSTAGTNSNISVHFDWFTTTQGVKNLQEQYTLNGSTWININSPLTAVSNGWRSQTIDLSGIAGAGNNANFGIRLVSVYDSTLAIPNYGSADGGQGGYYNNNSGNWRFTNVSFSGTVPEPSSIVLTSIASVLAFAFYHKRRSQG